MKYVMEDVQLFLYSYRVAIVDSIVEDVDCPPASYELSNALVLEHVQFSIAALHIAM